MSAPFEKQTCYQLGIVTCTGQVIIFRPLAMVWHVRHEACQAILGQGCGLCKQDKCLKKRLRLGLHLCPVPQCLAQVLPLQQPCPGPGHIFMLKEVVTITCLCQWRMAGMMAWRACWGGRQL